MKLRLEEGREVVSYGRNIFMGYLNRDNETKVDITINCPVKTASSRATVNNLSKITFSGSLSPEIINLVVNTGLDLNQIYRNNKIVPIISKFYNSTVSNQIEILCISPDQTNQVRM